MSSLHVPTLGLPMLIDVVHHIEFPDAAKSSNSDEGELFIEDNVTTADFKPQSFSKLKPMLEWK
jgi:hypothetical protein